MKITREEVQRVALLARLSLEPEEEERLTYELDKILEYMDKLSQVNTDRVEPLAHVVDAVNAFREDRITSEPATDALLANAPATENTYFKVPKILE